MKSRAMAARKVIIFCLFVSATALVLLASNEAVEKSVASAPRKGLGDNTPADPRMGPDTVQVLSYQDSETYRFLIIGPDETPPPGFEKPFPDFDPSAAGFRAGTAAFGFNCFLESNITTDWPINTQLLVRRTVFIPAGATNVRVMVSVDNDIVALFFNETLIAENLIHEGCAIPGEATFSIDVPQEANGRKVVQSGGNLVVYWLRDRGGGSFFDTRILAELPPPALTKAAVGLARIVQRQFPKVPVSNVTVECSPGPQDTQRTTIKYQVEGTGEAGMITQELQRAGLTSGQFFLDGTLMASIHVGPSSVSTVRTQALLERTKSSIDPAVESLDSVMSSRAVAGPFYNCVASYESSRFMPIPGEPHKTCVDRCVNECEKACDRAGARMAGGVGAGALLTARSFAGAVIDGLGAIGGGLLIYELTSLCKDEYCPRTCEERCPPDRR